MWLRAEILCRLNLLRATIPLQTWTWIVFPQQNYMDSPPTSSLEDDLNNAFISPNNYSSTPSLRPRTTVRPAPEATRIAQESPVANNQRQTPSLTLTSQPPLRSSTLPVAEKEDELLSFVLNGIIMAILVGVYYWIIEYLWQYLLANLF